MTSATVLTLLVIPAAFLIWQTIVLNRTKRIDQVGPDAERSNP
jgi:hypothetical protein